MNMNMYYRYGLPGPGSAGVYGNNNYANNINNNSNNKSEFGMIETKFKPETNKSELQSND